MDKKSNLSGKGNELTLMDAVDNLSALAEIESAVQPSAAEKKRGGKWLKATAAPQNQEEVKATFRILQKYLEHIYKEERARLKDPETQKGIQAIMVLAKEAADKVDRFTDLFQGKERKQSVTELKEYQDLQKTYLTRIIKRFQETLAEEEEWQAEWGGELAEDVLDIERRGLKDLETVRRDHDYDLFYLRKEDGRLFFNRNLLRHIRLVGNFDEAVSVVEEGDPLLKIEILHDHIIQEAAQKILAHAAPQLDAFYKQALAYKESPFVALLNKAIMALMLAANARNSIEVTSAKSCLLYFCDFHLFLRQALLEEEYQRVLMRSGPEIDPFRHSLINLSHALCIHFFLNEISSQWCVQFLLKLVGKEAAPKKGIGTAPFFARLMELDEEARGELKKYPSGPILKVLDVLHLKEEERAFDPLSQQNFPHQLYDFKWGPSQVTLLHLPSPIFQAQINQVQIVEEFKGFVRALEHTFAQNRLLLINLQDRTSWHEHARSVALEQLQQEAEFARNLFVVSLPKNSDFYLQSGPYLALDDASDFKKGLLEQIASGAECGFFFPSKLKREEILSYSEEVASLLHTHLFGGVKSLNRSSRLDFIELFSHLLITKLIEWLKPDCMSFTCKDGIDTGSAQAAGLYIFLRLIKEENPTWNLQEQERVIGLFYHPALLVRERMIDVQRFHRTLSALSLLNSELTSRSKKERAALLSKLCNF